MEYSKSYKDLALSNTQNFTLKTSDIAYRDAQVLLCL